MRIGSTIQHSILSPPPLGRRAVGWGRWVWPDGVDQTELGSFGRRRMHPNGTSGTVQTAVATGRAGGAHTPSPAATASRFLNRGIAHGGTDRTASVSRHAQRGAEASASCFGGKRGRPQRPRLIAPVYRARLSGPYVGPGSTSRLACGQRATSRPAWHRAARFLLSSRESDRVAHSRTRMFRLAHISFRTFGHTVTLTSPRWALRRICITVRDWPMPPPILSGISSARIAL